MAATARVTVLMEHAQKLHLARCAQAAGMSVGEYIRDRALDEGGNQALLEAVRDSAARANAALERVLAAVQAGQARDAEREAALRVQARCEFGDIDFDELADWLDGPAPELRHVAEPQAQYRGIAP